MKIIRESVCAIAIDEAHMVLEWQVLIIFYHSNLNIV